MRKKATAFLCALLVGCASPHFVKLDGSGRVDVFADPTTVKRDLADCQVVEANTRREAGFLFGRGTARIALDNCMRSKGYLKT
jgi:hypothetical protein